MSYLKGLCLLVIVAAGQFAFAAGNAADGAVKAELCAACHGLVGLSSNPLWPNLAGQHEAYLGRQIKAFRDGTRQEPTMQPFVSSLSDQDADDLAAHYAGLKACQ